MSLLDSKGREDGRPALNKANIAGMAEMASHGDPERARAAVIRSYGRSKLDVFAEMGSSRGIS